LGIVDRRVQQREERWQGRAERSIQAMQPVMAQGTAAEAQQARRPQDVALRLHEGLPDASGLIQPVGLVPGGRGLDWQRSAQGRQAQLLQALGRQHRFAAEQRHALHQMAQLAHVAQPVIAQKPGLGRSAQPLRRQPMDLAVVPQKMPRQAQDVIAALAEGGKVNTTTASRWYRSARKRPALT
jgi:hypothetical protein